MSQLTIKLNQTNKAQFCEWLNDYTKRIGGINSPEYPYMGGGKYRIHYYDVFQVNNVSFSARVMMPPLSDRPPLDSIQVLRVYDPEENVTYTTWIMPPLDNALSLSWLEVEGGVKVTIKHEGAKWIIPPVFVLLAAMKADYPSASDDITRYIVEQAELFNLVPSSFKDMLANSYDDPLADTKFIAQWAWDEFNKKTSVEPAPVPVPTVPAEAVEEKTAKTRKAKKKKAKTPKQKRRDKFNVLSSIIKKEYRIIGRAYIAMCKERNDKFNNLKIDEIKNINAQDFSTHLSSLIADGLRIKLPGITKINTIIALVKDAVIK
jgi:hypothetical protein